MGRIKPKIVAQLMDLANRFADGKDACNNKRMRSPEDGRGNRYGNQRQKSCNYDNCGSHSQVATGYKENTYQGDDRRTLGYRNNNREDSSSNKQFQPRGSRDYNQSPDDVLNWPCHMHYAFINGKRVSRHAMKDCRTFLKLQEAVGHKQPRQEGKATTETQATHLQQINKQPTEQHKEKISQIRETKMMEDTSHQKAHLRNDTTGTEVA
jgi:hypothetical protein